MNRVAFVCSLCAFLAGCAGYVWTPQVPDAKRTIAVPVFENRTSYAEFGPVVTRQTLREFQRDGAFRIRRAGDSALELQGAVTSVKLNGIDYDRGYDHRASEYRMTVAVSVSLVDKEDGKVLFENRKFTGETTFLSQKDQLSGQRNAADRIALDVARQLVDAVRAHFASASPDAPAR